MQKILLLAALAVAVLALSACAFHRKPKSEAHIYEGDAPNIRYAPSNAGGPQSYY